MLRLREAYDCFVQGSVSGHLRKKHEEEDCQVIMITNQGMLKVDKEDFLPAKKMWILIYIESE